MGNTILNIVIWGGKSSVLWSYILFYGSAVALLENENCNQKANDLPPTMANIVDPYLTTQKVNM